LCDHEACQCESGDEKEEMHFVVNCNAEWVFERCGVDGSSRKKCDA